MIALAPADVKSVQEYQRAVPFPHCVLHDLFPAECLRMMVEEFPSPACAGWKRFKTDHDVKLATDGYANLPSCAEKFVSMMHCGSVVDKLEKLTGISGLVGDPHIFGGGLHCIERGGFLKVHADFTTHPHLKLARRLNLIVYLNEGWQEEWGGHLELWSEKTCVRKIAPLFNRTVIFSTSDTSYHGHPHPLLCPEGVTRKSLALYYYSKNRGQPIEEIPSVKWHGEH